MPSTKFSSIPQQAFATKEEFLSVLSKARASCQLPVVLGIDEHGNDVFLDLTKSPHILISGTTGSGKSVCTDIVLSSLFCRFSPAELSFLLVDFKAVELWAYENLPYLALPIQTSVEECLDVLDWLENEIGKRYVLLVENEAKDIDELNAKLDVKQPLIVALFNEYIDIVRSDYKDVFIKTISKIIPFCDKVGVHVILTTVRPCSDSIPEIFRTLFATKLAFNTCYKKDSTALLGQPGAEKLAGRGDCLMQTSDGLMHLQISFLLLDVIKSLVQERSGQCKPKVIPVPQETTSDIDLLHAAIKHVIKTQMLSISILQRKLGVGYNKAASLMERMEKLGVISPQVGTAPRQVLMTNIDDFKL